MPDQQTSQSSHKQVFVSYSYSDKDIADRVAQTLLDAGVRMAADTWELGSGESILQRVQESVASSDILLVLLSPNSVGSRWVQYELNAALDRAILVLPMLIEDCDIPLILADKTVVDLRSNFTDALKQLAEQIRSVSDIDYAKLDVRSFERMVSDLLINLGFSLEPSHSERDGGWDFIARHTHRGPFGTDETETWMVEVKLYRHSRVSLESLRYMLYLAKTSEVANKGLVITNGRLTSVAKDFLKKSRQALRVIDGSELTKMLMQRPALIRNYFLVDGNDE